ncbi:hypothetical protein THAR02_09249 [Trichoderma harzianum]|uniref:Uncharacterized protein n=1 Tax=Trichoderma harzianum TaxID=5544 RepID=A0A0F9X034_TRIHA|nr:hypothetical protein THAR02_09249 [Trichoderma harzianum]
MVTSIHSSNHITTSPPSLHSSPFFQSPHQQFNHLLNSEKNGDGYKLIQIHLQTPRPSSAANLPVEMACGKH